MSNVVKLEPVEIGEGFRFDPDELLEAAKGVGFTTLVILGELEDGTQWTSGSANTGETLILIERAKHNLLFGEDD
ncbi:MAG: phosphoribosylformylglycinamidine synthase [Mesorhizobium sp.]|uniref:phosphoribosylformylglycinamidine synthase n=1 Tax=Mesorhizobium sp. TaxID=1871066 RepID=UPI000FE5D8A8|nr:phosphoribosylformylglycinamidine synthase [Mesorhizobium sp.]RWL14884.1 MAG: phosphoribosylformylglycinamidine synthase [Mesorhizobium sp.]